jgi:sugar/nucleoside kinase (ribokinase family)
VPVLDDNLRLLTDRACSIEVLCIGNALVDRLAEGDEGTVKAAGLELGAMTLVGADEAATIEAAHPSWREVAGGSAANTAAGLASLGRRVGFVGTVGDDQAGSSYVADLKAIGVIPFVHHSSELPTGLCHVLVSPGGERSMATSLGAAGALEVGALESAAIGEATLVYVEGYLLDAPLARPALERTVALAREGGTLVALTLSDPFVVERHRPAIKELLDSGSVDVLFGNEDEAVSLTETGSLGEALDRLAQYELVAVITRGAAGSVAVAGGHKVEAAAVEVEEVIDTTGAGDLFAAGVLGALVAGRDLAEALSLGALAAGEVIGHFGARPESSLAALFNES